MTDFKQGIPDPEVYWPEAEELIDAHFRRKSRRRYILLILFLLIGASALYFNIRPGYQNKERLAEGIHTSSTKKNRSDVHSVKPAENPQYPERQKKSIGAATPIASQLKSPSIERPEKVGDKFHSMSSENENILTTQQLPDHSLPPVQEKTYLEEDNYPVDMTENQCEDPVSETPDSSTKSVLDKEAIVEIQLQLSEERGEIKSVEEKTQQEKNTASDWGLIAFVGFSNTTVKLSGPYESGYLQRRDLEEHSVVLPQGGIQLSKTNGKWDFRAGIGFGLLGEQVNYSPYSNGMYTATTQQWQPFSYTQTDTDSAYIYGMLFFQANTQTVSDSQLVTVTDTLNGQHYNPSIATVNGRTRHYLLNIPIEAIWQYRRGKWGLGISAGLNIGILFHSEGHYLTNDETGTKNWKKNNSSQTIWQVGAGLACSYQLSDRFSLMLAPHSRFSINPIHEKDGADKYYRTLGVNTGIRYTLP